MMSNRFLLLCLLLFFQTHMAHGSNYFPCLQDGTCSTGYLKPSPSNNGLFYWFFPATDGNKNAPVILWLQGGPGCSSMLGLFMENGPMSLSKINNSTFEVKPRAINWSQKAHMLFLDQPVGTGYAVAHDGRYVTSDKEAGQQVLFALVQFFMAHPDLMANPLFISGESYGGHWVPAVTTAILEYNRKATRPLALAGISAGDPLIDAYTQVQGYADYALQTDLIPMSKYKAIKNMEDICVALIKAGNYTGATDAWNAVQNAIVSEAVRQPYDIRYPGADDPDMDLIQEFLDRADVKAEIGVPSFVQYQMCNMKANAAMNDAFSRDVSPLYAAIARAGIKALIYCGNMDPAVPCPALQNVINSTYASFSDANVTNVKIDGKVVAWAQKTPEMWFYNFFDAGHMVPEDQPQPALDMMYSFMAWALKR